MKNIFRNSLYNGIGFIFPAAVTFFTTPYIVYKLTPQIYGIYFLTTSMIGMMSFLDFGFGQGIIKFVSQYQAQKNYSRINKIIGMSVLFCLGMGLTGGILIWLSAEYMVNHVFHIAPGYAPTAVSAFRIAAFGFVFYLMNGIFSNLSVAIQRYDIFVKVQYTFWFFSTVAAVALLYLGKDLTAILKAQIFFQILAIVCFYFISRKLLPYFRVVFNFESAVFKEMFNFSFFTAINSITGDIVFRVDKMIIGALLGMEAITYYQIPFLVVQLASRFINAIAQLLFPTISSLDAVGNKVKIKEIYLRSSRYVVAMSFVVTSGLVMLGHSFISIWMGAEFAEKVRFVMPVIAIVFFFVSVAIPAYWFYNGLGYASINMFSSLFGAGAYLIAAFFLISSYKLIGAAMAFAFILLPAPFYFYKLHKVIGIETRWLVNLLLKLVVPLLIMWELQSVLFIPSGLFALIASSLVIFFISISILIFLRVILLSDWNDLKISMRLEFAKK